MYKNIKKSYKALLIILTNIFILIVISAFINYKNDATALSKIGSRGEEVKAIQQKLNEIGIFNDNIDGIYGQKTATAIKTFQERNGLQADGIAGPQTLKKLGISSSPETAKNAASSSDEQLLARIISAESRGEPYMGQVAVGSVIMNRVKHPSFPDTLAGVIYENGAFTAIVDGQFNEPIAESAVRAARDALNGQDPTGGAIYYFNPSKTSNAWMHSRPVIKQIGDHLFCT